MIETNKKYTLIYNTNNDLKELIKYILKDNSIKQIEIAKELNISKSDMTSLLNKKHITLDDMKKIFDILGYQIELNIEKKK